MIGNRVREAILVISIILLYTLLYYFISNLHYIINTESLPDFLRNVLRPAIIPPLQNILREAIRLTINGILIESVAVSTRRVILGLAYGVPIGFTLGFIMGWITKIEKYIETYYVVLRFIPPLSFVTLFILWFGIGEFSKVLLITYSVMMVMILPIWHGVKEIPSHYLQAASTLGVSGKLLVRRIVLPSILPNFFVGLRYAVMVAWLVLVASELIAAKAGIGYMILAAQRLFQTSIVMLGIAILGLLGLTFDYIVRFISTYFTRWMKR